MAKPINKKLLSLLIAIPAVFSVLTIYSFRQPYIPSEEYLSFATFILFPALALILLLFVSFKKWKKTGLTGLQMRLQEADSFIDRFKIILQLLITAPAFTALMVWATHGYIAWPLQLFQGERITFEAEVIEHNSLRRTMSGLTKLKFKQPDFDNVQTLRWSSVKSQHYKVGDTLTLTGKRTWFGIIVEHVE